MIPQPTQDVIGRYASGRVRPYRSRVITSCLPRARTVAWATRARIMQGRALLEAPDDEGGEHGRPPRVVGIDVSKAQLDVAVRPSGPARSIAHTEAGIATLVEQVRTLQPSAVVLDIYPL